MFHVVPHAVTADVLGTSREAVLSAVRDAYLTHDAGDTVNPSSHFLRFPDKPASRIIALPAFLGSSGGTPGIKWISSFPSNLERGLPRASAVLLLNDYETGRPIACLEAAHISAARTAASAALAATVLRRKLGRERHPGRISFIGTGVIATTIATYLRHVEVPVTEYVCHDLNAVRVEEFLAGTDPLWPGAGRACDLAEALDCDVVVFATTAGAPYLPGTLRFRADQVVLNISLRDIHPETMLAANNILDDVAHCLTAATSPHLAEQLSGSRDFVTGTLAQVIDGRCELDAQRPTIFSPFGLGVLDIAVGRLVLDRAVADPRCVEVPNFLET
ncbi:MAG: 2,3-diaminopropionate biosynthesis protein SbnB [Actinocatenispora sp.]